MTSGSYSVNVRVEGSAGAGTAVVPVASLATKRLAMRPALGWTLAGLGVFLVVGLLTIVRAAVREGMLEPGNAPDARRARRARAIVGVAGVVLGAAVLGGWSWWDSVDRAYARGLFRALHATPVVRVENGERILRLTIDDSRWTNREITPIIPDHGKMMHLFLVREPSMDAFAHVHPALVDASTFDARLGQLPAGRYRVYADIVHESGLAETITSTADVGEPLGAPATASDPDDGVLLGLPPAAGDTVTLESGAVVVWHRPGPLTAGSDGALSFTITEADRTPAKLEPYLGMPAHAMVSRADGQVFMHLHAMGSISPVSQQVLQAVERGDTLPSVPDRRWPRAVLRPDSMDAHAMMPNGGSLQFPFAFPEAGRYRIWVQVRRAGRVETAAFEATVSPASR
jgi:hypothetical protein